MPEFKTDAAIPRVVNYDAVAKQFIITLPDNTQRAVKNLTHGGRTFDLQDASQQKEIKALLEQIFSETVICKEVQEISSGKLTIDPSQSSAQISGKKTNDGSRYSKSLRIDNFENYMQRINSVYQRAMEQMPNNEKARQARVEVSLEEQRDHKHKAAVQQQRQPPSAPKRRHHASAFAQTPPQTPRSEAEPVTPPPPHPTRATRSVATKEREDKSAAIREEFKKINENLTNPTLESVFKAWLIHKNLVSMGHTEHADPNLGQIQEAAEKALENDPHTGAAEVLYDQIQRDDDINLTKEQIPTLKNMLVRAIVLGDGDDVDNAELKKIIECINKACMNTKFTEEWKKQVGAEISKYLGSISG